ncbi:MAG: hypothetical protein NUW37_09045 [Planctomycetes bacterium]|nr:hypothetical protein [Planctomycetota bacterium]
MTRKCVVLISGGIDSTLAAKLMLDQGIEVEGINFHSVFNCCSFEAAKIGRDLGIAVTSLRKDDEYLDIIRNPKFQVGRGVNPCCDCRVYMFKRARRFMDLVGASFVVSGEVLNQRPNSQKRDHMKLIEDESDLSGRILRPLSAKLLAETIPEKEGIVDREKLFAFEGKSRTGIFALARSLGIDEIPTPSTGCMLTEKEIAVKVRDLLSHTENETFDDYQLLTVGRHFRLAEGNKFVMGRRLQDNEDLEMMHDKVGGVLMIPENFNGPSGLLLGGSDGDVLQKAAAYILAYTKKPPEGEPRLFVRAGDQEYSMTVTTKVTREFAMREAVLQVN